MTVAVRVAILVVLWLLAWGDVTLANVVSGVAVAVALLIAFPPARHAASHVHLSGRGILRLAGYVVGQLGRSNLVMARQIVRPSPATPGVLAHRLETPSDELVTVMSSIIALSPGTMTVDVAPDSSTIYVHFFDLDDVAAAHRSIARLEGLSAAAMLRGTKEVP